MRREILALMSGALASSAVCVWGCVTAGADRLSWPLLAPLVAVCSGLLALVLTTCALAAGIAAAVELGRASGARAVQQRTPEPAPGTGAHRSHVDAHRIPDGYRPHIGVATSAAEPAAAADPEATHVIRVRQWPEGHGARVYGYNGSATS